VLAIPDGSPVAWCLASPKLGEREVAVALLDRQRVQPGQVLIADKGLAGVDFAEHVAGLGATLVRPDRKDEPARFRDAWAGAPMDRKRYRHPQGPARPGTAWRPHPSRGAHRVVQRLLALAACVWFNWQVGLEPHCSLIAHDH